MNYDYCPPCGGRLHLRFTEGRERLVCERCGFIFYQNPVPAVAVILLQQAQVLLVKRKFAPCVGDWSLPAGFVEWGEGPEETAIRELKEETGLDIAVRGIYGVYRGQERTEHEVVLVVYRGEMTGGNLQPGDDALEAQWFALTNLPENIAFRIHRNILAELAGADNGLGTLASPAQQQ